MWSRRGRIRVNGSGMSRSVAHDPESSPRVRTSTSDTPLRRARLSAGLRQVDLAARCGLHPDTLRRLEHAEHHPNPRTAVLLAAALGVQPMTLFPSRTDGKP